MHRSAVALGGAVVTIIMILTTLAEIPDYME